MKQSRSKAHRAPTRSYGRDIVFKVISDYADAAKSHNDAIHNNKGSWGARLHDDLIDKAGREWINVYKGTKPDIDSYSAFW